MRLRQRGRHEPAPPKPADPKPAVFRDAPLVIMDEPTASLDARAESELFPTARMTT